jgi:hypothetical protein
MLHTLKGRWAGAILAAGAAAGTLFVLVLLARRESELMDVSAPLTAGYAKALVAGYVLAVGGIALLALVLPQRLLWLPVAGAAGLGGLMLLATLTVGGEVWSFSMALITMGACWRVGNWLLLKLRVPAAASAPPAAWLAGAGVVGLVLLLVGRLGALRWWTVGLVVIALGLSAAPPALSALRSADRWREQLTRPSAMSLAIAGLLLGIASVFAAAPELMYDALSSKAWLPHEWARSGSIGSLSDHPHLNLIGFAPLLAVPGHLVDAEGVGRYMQWLSLAGAAGSVWWLARRSPWAPVAAAALVTTPHLFWQATTAYDDAVLTLAGVGLAAGLVRMIREPGSSPLLAGIAAGALAGACVDLKIHLAALAAGLVAAWLIAHGAGRVRAALGALAGAAAVGLPPFLMRWIELGNPVLPTYNNVFKSRYWPVHGHTIGFPSAGGSSESSGVDPGAGSSALDRVTEPLHFLVHTATQTVRYSQAAPNGSFGLIMAAIVVAGALLWLRGRRSREVLVLWGGLVVAAIVWYQQFSYLRFVLPIGAVAIAALALGAPRAPMGPWLQRGLVAAIALTAALLWPPTVAQFWNVPGRDLPVKAALGLERSYDYERASMSERDAIAAFDRLSAPGDVVMTPVQERLWLTGGRDISPDWEVPRRLESASAPPPSEPTVERYRNLGVRWILGHRDGQPFGAEGVPELLDRNGEVAWADSAWLLVHLVDHPRAPTPLPCDELLEGRPGCWQGTLDHKPGYVQAESRDGIARNLPFCAGRTLVVDVTVRGKGPPISVDIDFDRPPRPRPLMHVHSEVDPAPDGGPATARVPATAPPLTRTGARITILGAPGRTVERVNVGALGSCRGG